MNQSYFLLILAALAIWNTIIQVQFLLLRKKLKTLFQGQKTANLESIIFEQIKRLRKTEENLEILYRFGRELEQMAQKGIQKVAVVRFNPFKDTGGNQSFSIAFLDSFDNGVIISTLFTREGTRIYAKPIEAGQSTYALSDEEKEAIAKAKTLENTNNGK